MGGLINTIGTAAKGFADTTAANSTATSQGGKSDDKYRNQQTAAPEIKDSYKKGGRVKRTGLAKVHKGERVLTRKQARKYSKKRGGKR